MSQWPSKLAADRESEWCYFVHHAKGVGFQHVRDERVAFQKDHFGHSVEIGWRAQKGREGGTLTGYYNSPGEQGSGTGKERVGLGDIQEWTEQIW